MSERKSSITRIADLVDPWEIDLGGHTSPDGAITIVFSDIEGSTEMVERLGDEAWFELLRRHNELVRAAVARHGGNEVKAQGDGFMLAFTSSRAALACAVDIQRALDSGANNHHQERMRVRIGLHSGFMIQDGVDYFGRNVILAARIADRARGGEILISDQLRDFVEATGELHLQPAQELSLKGLSGTHSVHPVDWRAWD